MLNKKLFYGKWQKCYVARPFNGHCQLALVPGAVTGNPARQDFAPLRNIFAQFVGIFIIYLINMFNAEAANLFFPFSALAPQDSTSQEFSYHGIQPNYRTQNGGSSELNPSSPKSLSGKPRSDSGAKGWFAPGTSRPRSKNLTVSPITSVTVRFWPSGV